MPHTEMAPTVQTTEQTRKTSWCPSVCRVLDRSAMLDCSHDCLRHGSVRTSHFCNLGIFSDLVEAKETSVWIG